MLHSSSTNPPSSPFHDWHPNKCRSSLPIFIKEKRSLEFRNLLLFMPWRHRRSLPENSQLHDFIPIPHHPEMILHKMPGMLDGGCDDLQDTRSRTHSRRERLEDSRESFPEIPKRATNGPMRKQLVRPRNSSRCPIADTGQPGRLESCQRAHVHRCKSPRLQFFFFFRFDS